MSKREIAAAAAKKYVLSLNNATANAPADRYHSVITLITLGKAEEAENINREKFLQAILTEFFLEHPARRADTNQPPWGGGVPQGAAPGASGEEFGGVRDCASPGAATPPGGKKGPWGGLTMLRANHG